MQNTTTRQSIVTTIALFFLLIAATQMVLAQASTAFTYQGRLTDNSTLASGAYDLQFALYDAVSAGTQQGTNVTLSNVPVTNGIFTVSLDFGSAPFAAGAPRFLQIGVRPGGSSATFTLLTPRQPLAPTPYAIRSQSAVTADTATNATQLGGVAANQFVTGPVVSGINGLSGNVTLAAGANVTLTPSGNTLTIAATGGTGNFIQNSTTEQANASFNISGSGRAVGSLSSTLISGSVVSAGSQFDLNGGRFLSAGGNSNIFAGHVAGATNAGGAYNSFFGVRAGQFNLTGSGNVFVGNDTGLTNSSGNSNTLLGSGANVAADGLSFATAIGSLATVSTNNTIVLGRSADTVQIPGVINAAMQYNLGGNRVLGVSGSAVVNLSSNTFVGVGAGASTTPDANGTAGNTNSFFGNQAGFSNTTGYQNAFFGRLAGFFNTSGSGNSFFGGDETGQSNTTGSSNSFFGEAAGTSNSTGNRNVFIGASAGNISVTGSNNTLLGSSANVGSDGLSYATAIGAEAVVATSNTIALGRSNGSDKVQIPGLGAAGSTQLCRNANNEISTCSSSLRYKTAIRAYRHGLDFIQRLQPISFTWKDGGLRDLGFGAEDVAKVDPLLVIYNKEGQVEGVKYDRLSALLVNAVKEQQAQIEELKAQVAALLKQASQQKAAGQQ